MLGSIKKAEHIFLIFNTVYMDWHSITWVQADWVLYFRVFVWAGATGTQGITTLSQALVMDIPNGKYLCSVFLDLVWDPRVI